MHMAVCGGTRKDSQKAIVPEPWGWGGNAVSHDCLFAVILHAWLSNVLHHSQQSSHLLEGC